MSLNTFDRAKAAQNFLGASQRPACRMCAHRSAGTAQGEGRFQCMKGGFFVSSYSICDAYQAKPMPGASS